MADQQLPDPVTEPCFRAFLRLWAFFDDGEVLANAPIHSLDIERDHDVRVHLTRDWGRLHPRVRSWITESESWWQEVSTAWGPGSNDERRRAHLRAYFRPQFVTLSRMWVTDGKPR